MNNIYLSKSKYCRCVQCQKILWLEKYKPECATPEDKTVIFENGHKVGELAKGLFGDYEDIPFDKTITPMIKQTEELMPKKPNVITEASFDYDHNFCSVDVLKNDVDGVEIYEVKSSTKVKDIYLDDAAYQYYVLSNLGYNVKKVCIVYVNNEYVKGELPVEDELDQYFNIEEVTAIALSKQDEIQSNIDEINRFMEQYGEDNEPPTCLELKCFNPYDCDFWKYCTQDLPKPNVFDVAGMWKSKKFEKYNEGKVSFEDLLYEDLNPKYIEQVDFEVNDKEPKINKAAIARTLNSLEYPLYFIDYETYNQPIPEVEGTKPYQQLPFQYSLHVIEEEGAPIEHKEFLAEVDDEDFIRTFAESMISNLPEDGSVIVYNKSFESSVNRKIGELYPEYADEMARINGNIVDFMVPFKDRNYYSKEMQGSYSIKYVLPALYPDDEDLDYDNLRGVHNGGEAFNAFLSLKGKSKEEQEETREDLLEYCKLDTLAMVKLWDKFKEVTG